MDTANCGEKRKKKRQYPNLSLTKTSGPSREAGTGGVEKEKRSQKGRGRWSPFPHLLSRDTIVPDGGERKWKGQKDLGIRQGKPGGRSKTVSLRLELTDKRLRGNGDKAKQIIKIRPQKKKG